MTFKEKLKQEHPEKSGKGSGGCIGCPCEYGYENENGCEGGSSSECEACWNREMTAPMTAEEAWEISKKLFADFSGTELDEIFGEEWSFNKIMELSPYKAKAKIDEWERNNIQVGDVVSHQGMKGVVTRMEQGFVQILTSFGTAPTYTDAAIKRLVKTGKHIDIQSVLEQIGKEE